MVGFVHEGTDIHRTSAMAWKTLSRSRARLPRKPISVRADPEGSRRAWKGRRFVYACLPRE